MLSSGDIAVSVRGFVGPTPTSIVTSPGSGAWALLAGARFVLAAIVVSAHSVWFVPYGHPISRVGELGGFPAVLGFLMVSGYSIAHSLSASRSGFYWRRILRIYPLYLSAIFFSLVPFMVAGREIPVLSGVIFRLPGPVNIIGNFFFLQNVAVKPIVSNAVVWTLGVEVVCYAFAPVLWRARSQIVSLLISGSAAIFLLTPLMRLEDFPDRKWGIPLVSLAWAWLLGFLFYRHRTKGWVAPIVIAFAGILVDMFAHNLHEYGRSTVIASAFILTIASIVRLPAPIAQALSILGDLSYPLYLFHLPSFVLAWAIGIRGPWTLLFAVFLVSACFLALDMYFKPIFNAWMRPTRSLLQSSLPTIPVCEVGNA